MLLIVSYLSATSPRGPVGVGYASLEPLRSAAHFMTEAPQERRLEPIAPARSRSLYLTSARETIHDTLGGRARVTANAYQSEAFREAIDCVELQYA